jgi:hypothetical protein
LRFVCNPGHRRFEATTAQGDLAGVEADFEVPGRSPFQRYDAFQIDEPGSVHAHDSEPRKPGQLGLQR